MSNLVLETIPSKNTILKRDNDFFIQAIQSLISEGVNIKKNEGYDFKFQTLPLAI